MCINDLYFCADCKKKEECDKPIYYENLDLWLSVNKGDQNNE